MNSIESSHLAKRFHRQFETLLREAGFTEISDSNPIQVGLALSGGLDSIVLLKLCAELTHNFPLKLHAFHVNHGLSANAGSWVDHCQKTCLTLGVAFHAESVIVDKSSGLGVEQSARLVRYAALDRLCEQFGCDMLLTAHHENDQAETVLINLLRGSGVPGLAGMQACALGLPSQKKSTISLLRPLLGFSRQELLDYAIQNQLAWVDDESNQDPSYTRNALRLMVIPELERSFPSASTRIARSARHLQEALEVLLEVAEHDYRECAVGDALSILKLGDFSLSRQNLILRFWIQRFSEQLPSTAWLAELRSQVFQARPDSVVQVQFHHYTIYRNKDLLFLENIALDPEELLTRELTFQWHGESSIVLPEFNGTLYFDRSEVGFSREDLLSTPLLVHHRRGGEKIQIGINRPRRELKKQCQHLGIPYWERNRLVMISQEKKLLYVEKIGINFSFARTECNQQIALRWEPKLNPVDIGA